MQPGFQEPANKLTKVSATWQEDFDESCSSKIIQQKFSKCHFPGHCKGANLV